MPRMSDFGKPSGVLMSAPNSRFLRHILPGWDKHRVCADPLQNVLGRCARLMGCAGGKNMLTGVRRERRVVNAGG